MDGPHSGRVAGPIQTNPYQREGEFFQKYFAKVDETNVLSENIKVYKYRVGILQHNQSSTHKPTYTSKKERLYQIEDEKDQIPDYMDEEEDQVYAMDKGRETFQIKHARS